MNLKDNLPVLPPEISVEKTSSGALSINGLRFHIGEVFPMLTRLKNGTMIDLAKVTKVTAVAYPEALMNHVVLHTADGPWRVICDDPWTYSNELATLVAKAQGSEG